MPLLILVRGLPGSGKTTLARTLSESTGANHFEADDFFGPNYEFDVRKLPQAHAACQESTRASLAGGANVIVSNTFTTHAEMAPYYAIAAKNPQASVIVQEIICKGPWHSVHKVPETTVARMRERWEP